MHNVNHYIENYDELTVDEVVQQLGGLSAEELDQVHVYEQLKRTARPSFMRSSATSRQSRRTGQTRIA